MAEHCALLVAERVVQPTSLAGRSRVSPDGAGAAWVSAFEEFARGVMAEGGIPGVAVAAARDGEPIYERGFGYRDAQRGLLVTAGTVFGVASVAKSFTALAIMLLEERGVLSVADPVQKWLPEFALPHLDDAGHAVAITLHHLLTHTSGLPREPGVVHVRAGAVQRDPDTRAGRIDLPFLPPDILDLTPVTTHAELLALLPRQDFRLLAAPGERYRYSSEGYALLGAVVERASARSLPAFVREHVLAPLGLTRTVFEQLGDPTARTKARRRTCSWPRGRASPSSPSPTSACRRFTDSAWAPSMV